CHMERERQYGLGRKLHMCRRAAAMTRDPLLRWRERCQMNGVFLKMLVPAGRCDDFAPTTTFVPRLNRIRLAALLRMAMPTFVVAKLISTSPHMRRQDRHPSILERRRPALGQDRLRLTPVGALARPVA